MTNQKQRRSVINKSLAKGIFSIPLLSIVTSAYADFDAKIVSSNPESITVQSHLVDKSKYARSPALNSSVKLKYRGSCDKGYLHDLVIKLGNATHQFQGLNGENQSISGNNGDSWKALTMPGQQVLFADNPTLIKACNDHVNAKLNQGFDLETILGSDSSVNNALIIPLEIKSHCKKKVGFSNPPTQFSQVGQLNVGALCKATNYQEPINVSDVEFRIDKQVTMGGVCKVQLKGALSTNKPNQLVRFRYEHIDEAFKKKLSGIHQVTTDHQGYANYAHDYPIPNGPGKERGKMRVIGVNHEFQSAQRNYAMSCNDAGPGTLQLAGKSTIKLKMKPIKNSKKPFGNQICPTKVKFTGTIKAGNDFSGKAVFVGQSLADVTVKDFSIKKGQKKRVNRVRNLTWSAPATTTLSTGGGIAAPLMTQDVMQGLNIVGDNSQNIILSVPRKSFRVSCETGSVQPGLQIQNGGFTTLPSHTGGGAPTDLKGNKQKISPVIPAKSGSKKKTTEPKKKPTKPKEKPAKPKNKY
ncbi:MAG: hypothetical protein ABJI60_18065 [Kangiellaceae bacterium]